MSMKQNLYQNRDLTLGKLLEMLVNAINERIFFRKIVKGNKSSTYW